MAPKWLSVFGCHAAQVKAIISGELTSRRLPTEVQQLARAVAPGGIQTSGQKDHATLQNERNKLIYLKKFDKYLWLRELKTMTDSNVVVFCWGTIL